MYSQTVLEHFGNPLNVGPPVGTNAVGVSGDPNAGPFMRVFLVIQDGIIREAGFETYGCVASIAAGSVLTSWLPGRSALDAGSITAGQLLEGLGGLPLGRESCASTAISALGYALQGHVAR